MTDEEIQKFNSGYMKEIEMSDKITVDPSGLTIEQTSELARMTAKSIYTQGYVAGEAAVHKIAYNEAIEEILNIVDDSELYVAISKLKKE